MNCRLLKVLFLSIFSCLWITSQASATILTFDGFCESSRDEIINQTYGDYVSSFTDGTYSYGDNGEGFTPNITVDYSPDGDMYIWDTQYNGLTNVLFVNEVPPFSISFTADPGYQVQLYDFDLGAYVSRHNVDSVTVFDSDGATLFFSDNITIQAGVGNHSTFSFASPLVDDQLTIQIDTTSLGDASDNVGIDNIRFGQQAVPVPGAFFLLGFGLIGLARIRRRHL